MKIQFNDKTVLPTVLSMGLIIDTKGLKRCYDVTSLIPTSHEPIKDFVQKIKNICSDNDNKDVRILEPIDDKLYLGDKPSSIVLKNAITTFHDNGNVILTGIAEHPKGVVLSLYSEAVDDRYNLSGYMITNFGLTRGHELLSLPVKIIVRNIPPSLRMEDETVTIVLDANNLNLSDIEKYFSNHKFASKHTLYLGAFYRPRIKYDKVINIEYVVAGFNNEFIDDIFDVDTIAVTLNTIDW